MAQVDVTINGQSYAIACDDGQEEHLQRLAKYIDSRVSELVAAVGQVGENRLLVMTALLVADELSDAYSELEAVRGSDEGITKRMDAEDHLSQVLGDVAERLESIADRVQRA